MQYMMILPFLRIYATKSRSIPPEHSLGVSSRNSGRQDIRYTSTVIMSIIPQLRALAFSVPLYTPGVVLLDIVIIC